MRNNRMRAMTVLACALAFAANVANARPHEADTLDEADQPVEEAPTTPAEKLAHMNAWLKLLVGRFRYDGVVDDPAEYSYETYSGGQKSTINVTGVPKSAQGLGDCIGVGDGPGMQCVLNVTWREDISFMPRGPATFTTDFPPFAPTMLLYGIDPVTLGIRYLQADNRGLVEAAQGVLKGNTAKFVSQCVNRPAGESCTRTIRIYATPDGKTIRLWLDIEATPGLDGSKRVSGYTFDLHRVPQDEADEALQGLPGRQ